MIRKLLGFIAFLFRLLWRIIDGARRVAFNLVLLIAVVALIVALVRPAPPVPEGAALLVHPSGRLVEQATIDPSFAFLAGDREEETVLPELLEAVRAANVIPRVSTISPRSPTKCISRQTVTRCCRVSRTIPRISAGRWRRSASRSMSSAPANTNPPSSLSPAATCRKKTAAPPAPCSTVCGGISARTSSRRGSSTRPNWTIM